MKSEDLTPGDDFGMMREMLQRRFARLVKEAPRAIRARDPAWRARPRARSGTRSAPRPAPDADRRSGRRAALPAATGDGRRLPVLARSRPHRRRQGPARGGAPGAGRARRRRGGRRRSSPSPRAATATPGARPSSWPASRPSSCRRATRRSISSSACATRRIASPSAAHRAKRKREMVKNPLDEIPGIGPTRKRALLHHFGTVKAIQRAALEDLMKAPGVNAATARAVLRLFPCLTRLSRSARARRRPSPRDAPARDAVDARRRGMFPARPMSIATPMRRSKALSLPNILTYGRLAAVPAVVALLFWPEDDWSRWIALAIFVAGGDHRLSRRLFRPRLCAAIGARPHARSDRRQAPGRRLPADAGRRRHDRRAGPSGPPS